MKIFKKMTPTRTIALGFFTVIIIGTLLLMMPFSSSSGHFTNFLDCLFTATSATCITGLSTVVTAEHWSIIGQLVILAMIQIGGLGFMAFVTLFFVILGKKITLRNRLVIRESYNLDERRGAVKFIELICKFTFFVELIGALILSTRFIPKFGFIKGIYCSIFHSVSAFCNAGFDVLGSNSLIDINYSGDYVILLTLMALIIVGGIGFPVVMDLYAVIKHFKDRKTFDHLKIHTKLAVVTTLILISSGTLYFFIAEYNNPDTLGNMPFFQKLIVAAFQSVTLRTAGFVCVDQGSLTFGSKFVSMLLMIVGGSPASTAGGVKTVTVAVIILSVTTLLKGQQDVTAYKRRISFNTIRKALAVMTMMVSIAFVAALILSVTETNGSSYPFGIDIFYEVFSAIDTVGVTTGLTPLLTPIGKAVIIFCMYIGRIGPITMGMLFVVNDKNKFIKYPDGKLIVG
ncbi:MAG: TrkH family potassium uptake protein [Lachnospirales bacterium]